MLEDVVHKSAHFSSIFFLLVALTTILHEFKPKIFLTRNICAEPAWGEKYFINHCERHLLILPSLKYLKKRL